MFRAPLDANDHDDTDIPSSCSSEVLGQQFSEPGYDRQLLKILFANPAHRAASRWHFR